MLIPLKISLVIDELTISVTGLLTIRCDQMAPVTLFSARGLKMSKIWVGYIYTPSKSMIELRHQTT